MFYYSSKFVWISVCNGDLRWWCWENSNHEHASRQLLDTDGMAVLSVSLCQLCGFWGWEALCACKLRGGEVGAEQLC